MSIRTFNGSPVQDRYRTSGLISTWLDVKSVPIVLYEENKAHLLFFVETVPKVSRHARGNSICNTRLYIIMFAQTQTHCNITWTIPPNISSWISSRRRDRIYLHLSTVTHLLCRLTILVHKHFRIFNVVCASLQYSMSAVSLPTNCPGNGDCILHIFTSHTIKSFMYCSERRVLYTLVCLSLCTSSCAVQLVQSLAHSLACAPSFMHIWPLHIGPRILFLGHWEHVVMGAKEAATICDALVDIATNHRRSGAADTHSH